ncbi:MAG TPA: FkbM family methyltransferase [Flavitalea sp.]|nr:FkbM family methyltransferase [Flavitalea sp.]
MRKLIGYHIASSGLFDAYFKKYTLSPEWQRRVNDVMASSDNALIPRVNNAGQISAGKQVMHNGLKIYLGSYYGPEYARMLLMNKGVHEPQEERVFAEVLKSIPEKGVMIEMGAFWSFYSMWFNQQVKNAQNFMIEPDSFNLGQGERNFVLNRMEGKFIQGFIGAKGDSNAKVNTIAIDEFVKENKIEFVHMLHSDIQGYEFEMLQGAKKLFNDKKVGYVFISTHSTEIHYRCLEFLKQRNFIILASADIEQTFSEDGLIAARAPYFPGINPVPISVRPKTISD